MTERGAGPVTERAPWTAIADGPLCLDELSASVAHPGAGAIATFVGVVRDENDGRKVTRLEYHAYRSMAERELLAIATEIERERPGVRVACAHRVGELTVGQTAVICAASAPHRGDALLACRDLIERVKARLPIWKREHGPDGPYWVGWKDARCSDEHRGHEHSS